MLRCVFAGLVIALLAACTSTQRAADTRPADLQVQVNVPPTWRPIIDDDIAETFSYLLRAEFERSGYAGNIVYVHPGETPVESAPLLVVNLSEWRVNRTGEAECLFSADLRTPNAGERDLGFTTRMDMMGLMNRGGFGLARAYDYAYALENAANMALRDL